MKASQICRACHRRLQAAQPLQAPQRLDRPNLRRFTTDRYHQRPSSSAQADEGSSRKYASYGDAQEQPSSQESQQRSTTSSNGPALVIRSRGAAADGQDNPATSLEDSPVLRALTEEHRSDEAPTRATRTNSHAKRRRESRKVDKSAPQEPDLSDEVIIPPSREIKTRSELFVHWNGMQQQQQQDTDEYDPDEDMLWWTEGFGKLYDTWWLSARLDAGRKPEKQPRKQKDAKQSQGETSEPEWTEAGKWLYQQETVAEIGQSWLSLDEDQRRRHWTRTMLSTLYKRPEAAHRVLAGTLNPMPSGIAIGDVLLFIAQDMAIYEDKKRILADRLSSLVLELMKKLPPGYVAMHQSTLGIIAQESSFNNVSKLHAALKESNQGLQVDTKLHFARRLGGDAIHPEDKLEALELIKEVADAGKDLNDIKNSSVVTALLTPSKRFVDSDSDSSLYSPTHALQALMEKGYTPNTITFTAYLNTLCERHDYEEVMNLFRLVVNSGLVLDKKFIAVVFRAAKRSGDAAKFQEALELSLQTPIPRSEIWNNALHAVLSAAMTDMRFGQKASVNDMRPFVPMLRLYLKKYKLEPLQSMIPDSLPLLLVQDGNMADGEASGATNSSLWNFEKRIVPVVDSVFSREQTELIDPSPTVLTTMFRGWIKSLTLPYDILALYSFFKEQLDKHDSTEKPLPYVSLVRKQGSLIHDAFILAMLQQPELARSALEVFGDMLKSNINPPKDESGWKLTPAHPMPSVYTFSLILSGLMRQRDVRLAESIIEVMKEHGIQPDLVTWNIMIKGYASIQDMPQTVKALQDMESSGFKPNEKTFESFGKLRDQRGAMQLMDKIIHLNAQKMTGEGSTEGSSEELELQVIRQLSA